MRRSATSSSLAPPLSAVDVTAAAAGARLGDGVFAVVWTICSAGPGSSRIAAMRTQAAGDGGDALEGEGLAYAVCSSSHALLSSCAQHAAVEVDGCDGRNPGCGTAEAFNPSLDHSTALVLLSRKMRCALAQTRRCFRLIIAASATVISSSRSMDWIVQPPTRGGSTRRSGSTWAARVELCCQ